MADTLEFSDISYEKSGSLVAGKVKLSAQELDFKNTKTGKLEKHPVSEIRSCSWVRLATKPALKVTMKDGESHRYAGFSEQTDKESIKSFVSKHWKKEIEDCEPTVRGWNWGGVKFSGGTMTFEVEDQDCFEIPLSNVSNVTSGRTEVALEFHPNDDERVSLMEMRFHIPPAAADDGEVDSFVEKVTEKAGIIQATGTALATLTQVNCATPRGRYDIKVYPHFIQLHGKTFDYKIPVVSILRLFMLPHKDQRQIYFVVSLDPPIKQGQTRYPYLILQFQKDDEVELEPGLTDEVLQEKYDGKLTRDNLKGPLYEVLSRLMKTVVNRKITVPGSFQSNGGAHAISCAHKSGSGYLYPLERGFMFVPKPPIHVRFEEIATVNFARSDVSTRSFDFEVETKTAITYTFTSIEKDEYGRLYDFVTTKQLRVRNAVSNSQVYKETKNDFGDSSEDDSDEHDPYKERLKKEARQREAGDDDDESDEEDSDYNPEAEAKKKEEQKEKKEKSSGESSEPDEEYDSEVGSSSSDGEGGRVKKKQKPASSSGSGEEEEDIEEDDVREKKSQKTKKPRKESAAGDGKKRRRTKKQKDPNAPKKPMSAYFCWLQANRGSIKEEGMSVTDVSKKAGELWKAMTAEDKVKWDGKAKEDKARYEEAMKTYVPPADGDGPSTSKRAPKTKKAKPASTSSPSKEVKSKETISTTDDSSDDGAKGGGDDSD